MEMQKGTTQNLRMKSVEKKEDAVWKKAEKANSIENMDEKLLS